MTPATTEPTGWRGFPIISPLYRSGPWLRDNTGGWLAHHTLTCFGLLHQRCNANGWWRIRDGLHGDFDLLRSATADETAHYVTWVAAHAPTTPAVLEPIEAPIYDTREDVAAATEAHFDVQHAIATDTGERLAYDAQIIATAIVGDTIHTWGIANDATGNRLLVGLDRKDRPRFFLAPLAITECERPPA